MIWIFVASIMIGKTEVYSTSIKYAFRDKALCEEMIRGLDNMKCIPLEIKVR